MAVYRLVVRHVRYWRGAPHKWSTVYHYTGSTVVWSNSFLQTMATQDGKMCYGPAGSGGIYQVEVYDQAAGGQPLQTLNLFDPTLIASSPGYNSGTAYTTTTRNVDAVAETALQVFWANGVSSSGKAKYLRKWYHACPVSASTSGSSADVLAADVTALTAQAQAFVGLFNAQGLALCGPSGGLGTTAQVRAFYGNHQMERGRRQSTRAAGNSIAKRIEGLLGNLPKVIIQGGEEAGE